MISRALRRPGCAWWSRPGAAGPLLAAALCALVVALIRFVVAPGVAAQPIVRVPRIGILSIGGDPAQVSSLWAGFLEELRGLGYIEGRNIIIERRLAAGKPERLPDLVHDLAQLGVDLVVATGPTESLAAKQALPTTPIVMVVVPDPVAAGLVVSLARPGGRVTGLTTLSLELRGKGLQLFREAMPRVTRVALLLNPTNAARDGNLREAELAARALGLQLYVFDARNADELERAFPRMVHKGAAGVIVPIDATFFSQRARIVELAARHRLPTIYDWREFVEAGGLMSYGPLVSDLFRRAAVFVAKILRGAKPADLPVEQPTKFELVINLRTARALGLTIPRTVLQRADQVLR